MGLTFAQRIMDEQDGELSIDSSEDQGTIVTFFLKKERKRPIRTKKL
jgi:signal transduction histidine kinase